MRLPSRARHRDRPAGRFRLGLSISILGAALVLLAPGCAWLSVDDREFAGELAEARSAIAAGDPASTLLRLERLAWRRRDSIEVRRLLADACRAVNTIESRRIAENALRELTVLDPDNPEIRFELAEIMIARGFDLDGSRQLERVLDREPRHARAHLALGYVHEARYRRTQWPEDLDQLIGHFSRAADLDPQLYEAQEKQVEALMLDDQWDSALLILERLREKWPQEGWLEALAGTCLARPGTYAEAERAFARALALLGDEELPPSSDLGQVTDPYTLAEFEDLEAAKREGFLRVFWRSKDPLLVTRVNERQVEHWRRVVMADLLYGHRRLGVRGWHTARGEMYIRYGAPVRAEYVQGSSSLFFSMPGWYHVYEVNGEELGVNFQDTALNGLFYFPFTSGLTAADRALYTEPQFYAHKPGGRWLAPAMQVASFAAASPSAASSRPASSTPPAASTRAEVYVAVPVDSLAAYSGSSLAVGTVVFDREWNEVARREEVLDLDSTPVAGEEGRVLLHEVHLDLNPGEYTIATQAEGEAGAVIGSLSRRVRIDRFGADSLELSVPEIAFAADAGPGPEPFRKGELTVVPNPTGQVRETEPLVLYFEIYNLSLADGRGRYALRYRISPADRRARSIFARMAAAFRTRSYIESHFEEEAISATVHRHLTIDVDALKSDRYAFDLEVTDLVSGAVSARKLEFSRIASAR